MIPILTLDIRKLIRKLGPAEKVRACYEAGQGGYIVYWHLTELGIQCELAALTLAPIVINNPPILVQCHAGVDVHAHKC